MLLHIIVVVPEIGLEKKFRRVLSESDTVVEIAKDQKKLWTKLTKRVCDLAVVHRHLVAGDPRNSISRLKRLDDPPLIVILTEKEDEDERLELVSAGCDAVLDPRLPESKLAKAFAAILERKRQTAPALVAAQRQPADAQISDFVAQSPAMAEFIKLLPRIARSSSSVLILGETGVGKERLARVLHRESPRKEYPFVAIHCGALPESLLESELFGHNEGAFTGATKPRRGCFELAHQGTIFLDEIGEMPLHLQSKLLRVLEDRQIRRIGSEQAITVDLRVMAATNRDLAAEVTHRQFRKDLYYRLDVMSLTVPPLRKRVEDIPELVEAYIGYLASRIGCDVSGITDEAVEAFCRYSWPGNVRELINVIERAMLICSGDTITLEDLPQTITGSDAFPFFEADGEIRPLPKAWLNKPLKEVRTRICEKLERDYLAALLNATNGQVGETADRAGIDCRTLFEKMKQYGLNKKHFRPRHRIDGAQK